MHLITKQTSEPVSNYLPQINQSIIRNLYFFFPICQLTFNSIFDVKCPITFFFCPSLHTRAIAWSSLAGFQSGSNITSRFAPIRFRPHPPALLLNMNTKSLPYSMTKTGSQVSTYLDTLPRFPTPSWVVWKR